MNPSEIVIVQAEEAGERLDKLLARRFADKYSRTYFQRLLEEELVLLNGMPVKKRMQPKEGDEIEVCFQATPEIDLKPENIPLEILYEDEDLIVVNKPAGMVVHPAVGHWSGTFVNALLYHCKQLPFSPDLRPGIVHRLDKETSGLLVAAKTTLAQQRLIAQFASRQVVKEYLAICVGNPGNVVLTGAIGRHPNNRQKMAVLEEGGRSAKSVVRALETVGDLTLVRVQIETGRTHQIRVHLQQRKTPVVGDGVYGTPSKNQSLGVERQLLHAYRLAFQHPMTQIPLDFVIPPPEDFLKFLKNNNFNSASLIKFDPV